MFLSSLRLLIEALNAGSTVLILFFSVAFLLIIIYAFRNILSHGPRTSIVQCWFCSGWVRTTMGSENAFVCELCEQYNGFSVDGGYNKIIPEQHALHGSPKRFGSSKGVFTSRSDVLCDSCTLKQTSLIQKLAEFEPKCDRRWSSELQEYKNYLERLYPLCALCRGRANTIIKEADAKLLPTFLSWWKNVHSRKMSESRIRPHQHNSVDFASRYNLPRPLYCLARVCTVLCLLALIIRPLTSSLAQLHCLVVSNKIDSCIVRLLYRFSPKNSRGHILPHCLHLLNVAKFFTLSPLAEFWLVLLIFMLQFIFVVLHCSGYFANRTRRFTRRNPFSLLLDVFILVLVSNLLVSAVPTILFKSNETTDGRPISLYGLFVIGAVFLPLLISVLVTVIRWINFCSADWKLQKQTLKESWPQHDINNSLSSESQYSKHFGTSVCSSLETTSPVNSSTITSPIPEFGSEWGIGSPKPLFRSPVLGWPPSRFTVQHSGASVGSNRHSFGANSEPFHSTVSYQSGTQRESDHSDTSLMTSVSRIRSKSRSRLEESVGSQHGRQRRKRRRRSGLIRFFLSLLFGRVETFKDVLAELCCLTNALLIGLIIYGMGRLFMHLVEVL